jgi:lipoprotein
MNKKIIAVALLILMISVVFISCGKKRSWEKDDTTAAPSETTSIEYTTDEAGEKFVTNINGELIPVTTGKDGSVEFYEDLITKTSEQAAETEPNGEDKPQKPNDAPTKSESGTVKIGTGDPADESHAAVIDWSAR